jgi:hypothetical protein
MQSKGMDEALPALGGSEGGVYANAVGMPAVYSLSMSNFFSIAESK